MLGPFLKIINVDVLKLVTNIFKSSYFYNFQTNYHGHILSIRNFKIRGGYLRYERAVFGTSYFFHVFLVIDVTLNLEVLRQTMMM